MGHETQSMGSPEFKSNNLFWYNHKKNSSYNTCNDFGDVCVRYTHV